MPSPRRRRKSESGFMLLFVFLLAAVAALALYMEMPRVAFESQRMKEELLVERGMEYQRAIQLYVRKNRKYPARLEDLESANGMRFLRRRYVDPMTGKDDWRFIKVGPMGEFIDSVTMKKDDKKKSENNFITEFAGVGQTSTNGQNANTVANRQRQSDKAGAPGSVGNMEGQEGGGQPVDPNNPQQQAQQGATPDAPFPPPVQQPGSQPGQANQEGPRGPGPGAEPGSANMQQLPPVGFPPPGQQQGQTGQQVNPGMPGFNPVGRFVPGVGTSDRVQNPFGTPASSQTGGQVPQQINPQGQQGGQFPTQNPQFANQIMGMITNPNRNQAGAFNNQGQQQPGQMGAGMGQMGQPGVPGAGVALGPGIAGVASKFEAEGIKVVNERTKYNEWEFIYDIKKDMEKQGAGGAAMGNNTNNPLGGSNQQQQQGMGSRNSGGFGGGSSSGFGGGSSSGFGNSSGSGFGNSSGSGFGNQGPGSGNTRRPR